ncbi:hypothetical protein D1871_02695 [Nakamurella silvestris]|nr:hypothetical protein D1871_02695 [Nakamurella silvestris]
MITVSETISTALPAGAAFDYLSAFEHTSEWDPGTPVVEKRSPGPVAVGTKYYAEAEFNGKRQPIDYVVTELGASSITLRGENKRVISVDTITVTPGPAGSSVNYTAKFTLKGIARLVEPFVKSRFQELAEPAVQGMKAKLDSLA